MSHNLVVIQKQAWSNETQTFEPVKIYVVENYPRDATNWLKQTFGDQSRSQEVNKHTWYIVTNKLVMMEGVYTMYLLKFPKQE